MKTIAVIGGGASGMAAAIEAAKQKKNVRVIILEHKDMIGKKILSTGNGRCNLTNEYMDASCFHSDTPGILPEVLKQFGTQDTLHFFEELGILTKSRNGYIYPRSGEAQAVLDVMCLKLKAQKAEIHTGVHVNGIKKQKKGFRIFTSEGTYTADRVILSAGSRAASVLGSDGSGYELAKSMGHTLVSVVPALVQLKAKNHPFAKASGVRADGKVTAYDNGTLKAEDTGELQITAYGISGIPVFQVSRHIARAIYGNRKAEITIDFLPDVTEEAFMELLRKRAMERPEMEAGDFLTGIFHKKLVPGLLELAHIRIRTKVKELDTQALSRLVRQCKHTCIEISDTNGFENAQVCAGGVRLDEIDSRTMESLYVNGLYITGELLDADGICGGYNLQWAWATGTIAGRHAAE